MFSKREHILIFSTGCQSDGHSWNNCLDHVENGCVTSSLDPWWSWHSNPALDCLDPDFVYMKDRNKFIFYFRCLAFIDTSNLNWSLIFQKLMYGLYYCTFRRLILIVLVGWDKHVGVYKPKLCIYSSVTACSFKKIIFSFWYH